MSKISFDTWVASAFDVSSAGLATSATAGWKSAVVDNSANLYLDALVQAEFGAVNTAPSSSKGIYLYAYSAVNTLYTGTGAAAIDGVQGTVTFPDITVLNTPLPLLGVVPYPVQNIALVSQAFSVARLFGGSLPTKWGIAMINHSGMTIVPTIYYTGMKKTVI